MTQRSFRHALVAGAVTLALGIPAVGAADDSTNSKTQANASSPQPLTGKQKATAIGAGTGAVAGALVGGPVGAVVGAGVGGYVGHEGTDAYGRVVDSGKSASDGSSTAMHGDAQVRKAQAALNGRGYDLAVDGIYGPRTESAVRDFQGRFGLAQTGTLDDATLDRLGVKS